MAHKELAQIIAHDIMATYLENIGGDGEPFPTPSQTLDAVSEITDKVIADFKTAVSTAKQHCITDAKQIKLLMAIADEE